MGRERGRPHPGRRHARHPDVERHPHDLVVDERPLRPQAVRAAHVAVVGGEQDHGVVPPARLLERAEHDAEALVGPAVELDVVVEVAQPRLRVGRVDVAPEAVLLVPPPLPLRVGLGVQVVVEVGGQLVDDFVVGVGERREGLVLLPLRRLEDAADERRLVGVGGLVRGLVDREPHHVVRVHEGDGEEPRVGAARVGPQPRCRVRRDDRVEVHAGAGPAHEVAVVALPVGVAVRLHVGLLGVGEVPLADVRRAVAGRPQGAADRGDARVELGVPGVDDVVLHAVAGEVAAGEHRGPRRRARRRVRPVVRELEALGHEPLPPRQRHRRPAATTARAPGRRRPGGCSAGGPRSTSTGRAAGGRRSRARRPPG